MRSAAFPTCLVIMDGFGLDAPSEANAISLAKTPVLDDLMEHMPMTRLRASGEAVGLPEGQMGNSEVGHLNIGAGRIVHQELSRINEACRSGALTSNPALEQVFAHVKEAGATLHLMGLLSDGGVHSSNEHLYALIRAAMDAGVEHIRIHCFMDGRDVPPESGHHYVEELQAKIDELTSSTVAQVDVSIASLSGRYYAMDRDNRWERVEKAFDALVDPKEISDLSPADAVLASYAAGVTDEFILPVSFDSRGINDGDAVIFFNFRPDRARELTRAMVDEAFDGFERSHRPQIDFVCLTEYDPIIDALVAFPKTFPEHVLADVLADAGLSQYHIAETEKYAHVTFFLNGGVEEPKKGEERVLIPSPKVATYDLKPEMSAYEVTDELCAAIEADAADMYIVNFANCDMVGHTGVIPAAVAAVEAVDRGVGAVVQAIKAKGGVVLITADHGNADKMIDADGSPFTAHTTNEVPFILVDATEGDHGLIEETGRLADIAPTLLDLMDIPRPKEMTGRSLLA